MRSNRKTWVATVTPTQLQTGHQLWLYCWFEPNIYQLIPLTYKPIQGKLQQQDYTQECVRVDIGRQLVEQVKLATNLNNVQLTRSSAGFKQI